MDKSPIYTHMHVFMHLSIYVLLSEWLGLFISGFFNQLPGVLERIYVCRGFCVSTEVRI